MRRRASCHSLSFRTGTFGGEGDFFRAWGQTDVEEAGRLLDICLEAGVNQIDTADSRLSQRATFRLPAAPRRCIVVQGAV